MVQMFQLPETTQGRLGREMGQAFGQGVAKNFPDPKLRMEGQMQKGALDSFKKSLAAGDDPRAVTTKWAEAMAGVPGAQELSKSVLPSYLQYSMVNLPMGGEGVPPGEQQPMVQPQGGVGGQPPMVQGGGGEQLIPGMDQAQAGAGGIMPPSGGIGTPPPQEAGGDQMGGGFRPDIQRLAFMLKEPYEKVLQRFGGLPQAQLNAAIQQASEQEQKAEIGKATDLAGYVQGKLPKGTTPNDINNFMRIGQKYQNQGMSQEDWFRRTQKDYSDFTRKMEAAENSNIPGLVSGIMRGGKYREKALKRIEGSVQPLVELGFSDIMRDKLVNAGLSPTEAEMIIKPLDRSGIGKFKSLPKSPYEESEGMFSMLKGVQPGLALAKEGAKRAFGKPTYDQMESSNPELLKQITDKYSDFMLDNVKPEVSLLGLREKLRREKGMDWRHFHESLNSAMEKGLVLNEEQQAEMSELTSAPRDSLTWIFQDSGRWIDYLRGKK